MHEQSGRASRARWHERAELPTCGETPDKGKRGRHRSSALSTWPEAGRRAGRLTAVHAGLPRPDSTLLCRLLSPVPSGLVQEDLGGRAIIMLDSSEGFRATKKDSDSSRRVPACPQASTPAAVACRCPISYTSHMEAPEMREATTVALCMSSAAASSRSVRGSGVRLTFIRCPASQAENRGSDRAPHVSGPYDLNNQVRGHERTAEAFRDTDPLPPVPWETTNAILGRC